jgi:hypothetical protein
MMVPETLAARRTSGRHDGDEFGHPSPHLPQRNTQLRPVVAADGGLPHGARVSADQLAVAGVLDAVAAISSGSGTSRPSMAAATASPPTRATRTERTGM